MNSGVYSITNTVNGRRYIGSAINLRTRWQAHLSMLRRGTHHSPHLQSAWNKNGEPAFKFEALLYCDKDRLLLFEQRALDVLRPAYNIAVSAGAPMRGRHLSAEHRAKIGTALKGYKHTPEMRARSSAAKMGNKHCLGYKHGPETSAKLSAALKGKTRTAEQKARLSDALMGRSSYERTPEIRAKQSAAAMGHKRNVGRKHTAETRAKNSASKMGNTWNRGRKHTPEAVANMSAAQKARREHSG